MDLGSDGQPAGRMTPPAGTCGKTGRQDRAWRVWSGTDEDIDPKVKRRLRWASWR